ncbi:MAG: YfiR family protein, partial [Dongiaceae bacterium]
MQRAADIFARGNGRKGPVRRLCHAAGRLLGGLAALALLAVPAMPAPAQEANEYLVKAAFVYNFAKFTTWPAGAFADPAAPVSLCVVGKHDFGEAFDSVQGKSVGGRSVVVKYLNKLSNKDDCQVVYIAGSEESRLPRLVTASKSLHALTISEIEGFIDSGGMIRLMRDNNRIGFEINPKAAE